jgi:hypothetical protein
MDSIITILNNIKIKEKLDINYNITKNIYIDNKLEIIFDISSKDKIYISSISNDTIKNHLLKEYYIVISNIIHKLRNI